MYIRDGICYASEPSEEIRVKAVKSLQGGMLLLTFATGEQRLFDVNLLSGSAFAPLRDEKVLQHCTLFHGIPTWMNGEIDIAPETLYADSYPYGGREY